MRTLLALALLLALPTSPAARSDADGDVRLAVLVVVDQMTPDELARLGGLFEGGIARFLREGRVHRAALHDHAASETGPGHATIGTGVRPARHGIVGNAWRDRATGEHVSCTDDPEERVIGPDGPIEGAPGRSATRLRRATLAAALKAHDPDARVVAIAGKDRSALLTAGDAADVALWWDLDAGQGFVGSSATLETLPDWARSFDREWWTRLDGAGASGGTNGAARAVRWRDSLPEGVERLGVAEDDREGEAGLGGRRTFPYDLALPADASDAKTIRRLAHAVFATPFGDELVVELAAEAVRALELGADGHVDLLVVGLSSTDVVGHTFGPYARETADALLRADRALGELFRLLDERVGRGRWVAALTSDHGVLPLPEELARRGIAARRVPGAEVTRVLARAKERVEEELGAEALRRLDAEGASLAAEGEGAREARALVARVLAEELPWVARAFTRDEIEAAAAEPRPDPWLRLVACSYDAERSPDVVLVPEPYTLVGFSAGTNHGTPYPYDRAVPLAFLGPGFAPGDDHRPCYTVDVLPTLLARAGVPLPDAIDGRVLD